MAGGAGVEWYFGYKFAHNDLQCEDWRSRDFLWDQTRYALEFFNTYLPYSKMKSADGLTDNPDDYVFAQNGEIYTVYLPSVIETKIDLFGFNSKFTVRWFNPREGGALKKGTISTISGGSKTSIGLPPDTNKDWVAVIKAKKSAVVNKVNKAEGVQVINAISDFKINSENTIAKYYKDAQNDALAIDAAQKGQRDNYAVAKTLFQGNNGVYKISFVSMSENDGESSYVVKLNGHVLDSLVNPTTKETFASANHNLGDYYLQKNDIIEVTSKAVTNGNIPEDGGTAWSRGRWKKIILTPTGLSEEEQLKEAVAFEEKNGYLMVEAEAYHYSSANNTKREWYIRAENNEDIPFENNTLTNHANTASNNSYIEALPDTRVKHDDTLIIGENYFPESGTGGVVAYKVNISTPGRYYVWARAFSSGTEDNGLHVGIDGEWPESGARLQWWDGKDKWTWTWASAQRDEKIHCGIPGKIFLDIDKAGEHIIYFSMREDGFEMDKWMMTTDKNVMIE